MRGWRASSTRWRAPAWSAAGSISARAIRCSSSTRASASTCARRIRPGLVMAPGAPILALRRVGKTFANSVMALENFDLDVREGDFVSLLGPSGCGKSTALRLIASLLEPSRGEVAWSETPAPGEKNSHTIGFVFQEPTLMPWATGFANAFLPLRLAGVGREAGRAPAGT